MKYTCANKKLSACTYCHRCSSSLSGTNAVFSHSLKHRQTLFIGRKWQIHILPLKMSVVSTNSQAHSAPSLSLLKSCSSTILNLVFTHWEGDVASVSSTVYKPGLLSLKSHGRSTLTIFCLCTAYCIYLRPVHTKNNYFSIHHWNARWCVYFKNLCSLKQNGFWLLSMFLSFMGWKVMLQKWLNNIVPLCRYLFHVNSYVDNYFLFRMVFEIIH